MAQKGLSTLYPL